MTTAADSNSHLFQSETNKLKNCNYNYNLYHHQLEKHYNHVSILLIVTRMGYPVTLHSEGQNKNNGLNISEGALKSPHFHNTQEKELVTQNYFTTPSPSPVRCESLLINLSDIK